MSAPEMAAGTKSEPCRCLCTKNMYGTSPRFSETWQPGTHAASSYWCLLTQGPAGPDENYVHLARCVPGRACYDAPEE
ncbi:MAG TPA: hypothetical protein VND66_13285 [Acidobacteriaceae bacterium]|nr:hypothetical protein [Terriglobia bacterium]HVC91584.1 hypothetical protein [Acidobacteriaceae bacterium]